MYEALAPILTVNVLEIHKLQARLVQDPSQLVLGIQTPLIMTGPATIVFQDMALNRSPENLAFLTFELTPLSFPPDKTLIVLPGTNGANVTLECSTNLVDWSTATNGVYNNLPSAKFFGIKAERLP